MRILLITIYLILTSCGTAVTGKSQLTCENIDGTMYCSNDVQEFSFPAPQDGVDGTNGTDGEDGSDGVLAVIDPCDEGGEVLLVLSDGAVIAWYKNVGLYVIESDITYRTTDKEKCHFIITDGVYSDESGQEIIL